jgi:NAD+-dependent secondary alcohol dehydrogenase Adh1
VVLDYVGEEGAQKDGVEVLATNGVDFLVGSGAKLEIDILSQKLIPERSFVGNSGGTYNELVELVALAHRGVIEISTTRFPLEGVNEALHALSDGKLLGRGVLMVPED